jgi:hypothetical protein
MPVGKGALIAKKGKKKCRAGQYKNPHPEVEAKGRRANCWTNGCP